MLFPEIAKLTFDEYDSLLHAKYAYDNLATIKWIKKSELNGEVKTGFTGNITKLWKDSPKFLSGTPGH